MLISGFKGLTFLTNHEQSYYKLAPHVTEASNFAAYSQSFALQVAIKGP